MANTRWPRLLALMALLLTLIGGAIGPTGRIQASVPDCGDGHKWDDAQQMCVDQQPSDCVDGQVWDDLQQMCVASSTDNGGETTDPLVTPTPTEMATVPATETTTAANLTVSVAGCPVAYDLSAAGANSQNDCIMPVDGVQITYRVPDRPDLQPVQQPATGGTTTFATPLPGPFTLDASLQPGAPAPTNVAWLCQGAMSQPIVGTGMSITGTIQDGEQLTCVFFVVVVSQTTPTATPMVRQGVVAGQGQERGSIRIELSMCKQGFDPAASPGADLSTVCNSDYNFGLYPISFTAFGTTHDTATVGVTDSFFGWVEWEDNLGPDTYRVEATLPTGISTILFEYCGDGGTVENGKITFLAPVTAGGLFACGLDAVRDPAAPTPTRVPRADNSTLAIVSAVCPAGFVPGATETDPNRSCTGTTAGISYTLSGPAGSPNPLSVAGADNLSIRATPGVYHVAFTMPDTLASVVGARCTVYDLIESHWVDDVVLAPVTTERDVAFDIDLPGAMLWTCMVLVVPTGPSPTPSPSITPTATITPTVTATTTPPPAQSGTTSQSSSPSQSQSATNSQSQTSTTGQNAIVIGPQATATTSAAVASASPAGNGGIVIHAILCPVGTEAGSEGTCLTTYRGAVFMVRGAATGISLQATAGEILPDAAVFTELPPDTYTITQQRAAGIAETTGSCELFARNAQGMATGAAGAPVSVAQDTIQQVVDTNASVLVCTWYSLPDASFPELPSPAPPQGVSLTVHAFACPAGYDPANANANPAVDCLKPARGVAFSLAGATSGAATQLTTGSDVADPKDGSSHSGTIAFSGMVADFYTLTQEDTNEPVNAFVTCSLATATDAGVPVYPSVASGAITYQVNDNEALTCLWYVIPPAGAAGETPAGPMQGGAADDGVPTMTPSASGGQGGATDDSAPTNTPVAQQRGVVDGAARSGKAAETA